MVFEYVKFYNINRNTVTHTSMGTGLAIISSSAKSPKPMTVLIDKSSAKSLTRTSKLCENQLFCTKLEISIFALQSGFIFYLL